MLHGTYPITTSPWIVTGSHTLWHSTYLWPSTMYNVMQSDRNSSKTDTFHKPITYKRHVQTNNEQKTTFASHEYGRVGVFRIKISSLLPKLQPLEKCQFSNCSHLIESHCTYWKVGVWRWRVCGGWGDEI